MRDCSSCEKKPEPGTPYEDTPCAKCRAWEPESGKRKMVQMPIWWWKNYDQQKAHGLDTCSHY